MPTGFSSASRAFNVPVVSNVRHLGGLETASGPCGLRDVVRSGGLNNLTSEGVTQLTDLGIRTIVDLRTEVEREPAPEPDLTSLGIRGIWAPVVERDPSPMGVSLEWGHAGFTWLYQNFLEYGRSAIVQLAEVIAAGQGGVLYHCSAGEDRTGVVTAVLVALAGAPDDIIVADHAESLNDEVLAARGFTGTAAIQRALAPQHAMRQTLSMIRERWGGVDGYLLEAGASWNAIDAFRARATGQSPTIDSSHPSPGTHQRP